MTKLEHCVCDTNVLLSSLISRTSPPAKIVDHITLNGFFLFSETTLAELEEVIWRKKFDRYFSTEKRQNFLNNMRRVGLFYEIRETVELCRDKKDNPFLDVALAGKADCLITGDSDLLVLKQIDGTRIITAAEAMIIVASV